MSRMTRTTTMLRLERTGITKGFYPLVRLRDETLPLGDVGVERPTARLHAHGASN